MSYNRRSGGYGGANSGSYGNSYGQSGNNNFSGSGNYGGGGGNYNSGGGSRFNNYNNYGRNPKMSPWESGVSPGGGMMPNVHPNQMALASDLLSKLLAPNQGGYGGQNWGPNHGMMRRQESFKNQNRRRPDNRNRRPPPKRDDKKKDSKPEADKNDQSNGTNGVKKETDQEHVDYDGIPTAVLFCHVCSKHMWDAASFEKHVRGRPHELMMTYLDEGYKLQVELMRHQIKASENQREIDLERMQAQNKGKAKPLFRNYCPMCNINFYGPLTGHRKSDRHRKLKQFLHPECKMCDTLFHTRLEWDDHKLSSDHLRKVGEQRRQFNPDLKDDEFELLDVIVIEDEEQQEEIPVVSKINMLQDQEIKNEEEEEENKMQEECMVLDEPIKETIINKDTEDSGEVIKENETGNEEEKDTANEEISEETDIAKESIDNVKEEEIDNEKEEIDTEKEEIDTKKEDSSVVKKEKDEKYNPANVVGRELVVKTGGYVCRICSVFMKNDEEATLHCQTASHYINFSTITKLHAKINNRKRKMKEDKKENGDEDVNTGENEGDQPEKRARLGETENDQSTTELNGTKISETIDDDVDNNVDDNVDDDDDVQEIKIDVPVIEIADEEAKTGVETLEEMVNDVSEPEAVTDSSTSATKTTPTRGRGGRGRGAAARRGRSSR